MNVSIENQVVWLTPERTGSSITKKILENYNFFTKRKKNDFKLVDFRSDSQSHENTIYEEYKDFKIIVNVRNPYDRVFGCYQKYFLEKPILKNELNYAEKFRNFISKTFYFHGSYVFMGPRYDDVQNFYEKWIFDKVNVDYLIKMESLETDIFRLPFIRQDEVEKKRISDLLEENPFKNERYRSFLDVYDFKSAKLVYEFFKPWFYKFEYSPFSFTNKELSEQEKISFIHSQIQ